MTVQPTLNQRQDDIRRDGWNSGIHSVKKPAKAALTLINRWIRHCCYTQVLIKFHRFDPAIGRMHCLFCWFLLCKQIVALADGSYSVLGNRESWRPGWWYWKRWNSSTKKKKKKIKKKTWDSNQSPMMAYSLLWFRCSRGGAVALSIFMSKNTFIGQQ
jgi:hypothetical protein